MLLIIVVICVFVIFNTTESIRMKDTDYNSVYTASTRNHVTLGGENLEQK